MARQGSVIVTLRRSELYYLEQLLSSVLPPTSSMDKDGEMLSPIEVSNSTPIVAQECQMDTPMGWDPVIDIGNMNPDPSQLFDLAFQFGIHSETDIIGNL